MRRTVRSMQAGTRELSFRSPKRNTAPSGRRVCYPSDELMIALPDQPWPIVISARRTSASVLAAVSAYLSRISR